jgi:N6-L-threonylcarbamoyladenine synthase
MNDFKTILAIETSCDETAAAVVQKDRDKIKVLSNVVGSSADLQAKFGGVIPEQAARKQLEAIIPVIQESLEKANMTQNKLDAIAVTYGPGLIGSLLVGVETAKTLSLTWNKPLLPINHLIGHYYANWIDRSSVFSDQFSDKSQSASGGSVTDKQTTDKPNSENRQLKTTPQFPCIGLLVSGGHTDLVLFKSHNNYQYLGGTRDDAAGECFDKCARLLGYPYPGGPKISQIAQKGDSSKFKLPIPMNTSENLDFSFSGLKTAFYNLVKQEFDITSMDPDNADSRWQRITNSNLEGDDQKIADLCASLETTIVRSLVKKTLQAVQKHHVQTLIVGGGVSANQKLRENLKFEIRNLKLEIDLHFPEPAYCGDNAAMIGTAAFFAKPIDNILQLQADPNLGL